MARKIKLSEAARLKKIKVLERYFNRAYSESMEYFDQAMEWAIDRDLMMDLWSEYLKGGISRQWEEEVLNNTIDDDFAQHNVIEMLTLSASMYNGFQDAVQKRVITWENLTNKRFVDLGDFS